MQPRAGGTPRSIVLDSGVGEEQIGGLLRGRIGIERMRAAWAERRERLQRDHGHLAMMHASTAYLRQFIPAVGVRLSVPSQVR